MDCMSVSSQSSYAEALTLSIRFLLEFVSGAAAAAAKSLQSCPTLCDPIDGSPPGLLSLGFSRQEHWSGLPFPSPMHESEKSEVTQSCPTLATPWTAAYQPPPSMGFSRQKYWSGVPLPSLWVGPLGLIRRHLSPDPCTTMESNANLVPGELSGDSWSCFFFPFSIETSLDQKPGNDTGRSRVNH